VAKKVTVIEELIDDLDGGEASETLMFGVDGTMYEIDLNDKNVRKFRRAVEPFVENARKAKRSSSSKKVAAATSQSTTTTSGRSYSAEVRKWAASAGIEVNPTGRIPQDVRDQYEAAQAG
jgi:hypothetical protein